VREARASLEEERSRLAALMADLSQSVVVCNLDGRVLLYNQRAKQELSAGEDGSNAELLGLGRSIYTVFDRALIEHALERLQQASRERAARRGDRKKLVGSAQFVTATRAGRLLRAHMSPVLGGDGPHRRPGWWTFDYRFRARSRRRDQYQRAACAPRCADPVTDRRRARAPGQHCARRPKCSPTFPTCRAQQRDRFLASSATRQCAVGAVRDSGGAFSNDLRERWLLEEILGAELARWWLHAASPSAASERRALAVKTEHVDEGLWLRVDSFGLLQALRYLALRLQDEYEVREVRLSLTRSGHLAQLDLSGRHLHEQRNGDELVAGSDEYRRRKLAAERRRCDRALQRRHLVSARAGFASRFFPDHAAGRRGAEGSAAGDHRRSRGRASRVL
jgi:DNA polymerase-3 subunit epsilon